MRLETLRPLYDHQPPFASVYLDMSRNTERAVGEIPRRWNAVAEQLADQGCDPTTIARLGTAIREHPARPGRHGLAAFAADREVLLVEEVPNPLPTPVGTIGPLPDVMPLVIQRGRQVPYLRVVVDHVGADLDGATAGGLTRGAAVHGDETGVHKAQPGGWSQPRYQRRAENTWQRNATAAVQAVVDLATETGAEVLVVAGDPQSRPLLIEHLPAWWRARVVTTDLGSRAPGADPAALDEATRTAVADLDAVRTSGLLDRYHEQRGAGGPVSGPGAVVAALQRGQADTVLLADDASGWSRLWIGPEPTHLAFVPEDLRAMGVDQPRRAPADAALVRALVGTEAELVFTTDGLDTGEGVVLRWLDTPASGAG
jgi:release factor family 2